MENTAGRGGMVTTIIGEFVLLTSGVSVGTDDMISGILELFDAAASTLTSLEAAVVARVSEDAGVEFLEFGAAVDNFGARVPFGAGVESAAPAAAVELSSVVGASAAVVPFAGTVVELTFFSLRVVGSLEVVVLTVGLGEVDVAFDSERIFPAASGVTVFVDTGLLIFSI